jgi:dynein light chain roadblock-type
LLESLGRLSKKPGVLATIALDRTSGAILKTTGSISPSRTSTVTATSLVVNATSNTSDDVTGGFEDVGGIGQMASMVWSFVRSSAGLVQGLDAEVTFISCELMNYWINMSCQDEVKLLRLRTKKYELVIVPDSKYLLVAVHETPSA